MKKKYIGGDIWDIGVLVKKVVVMFIYNNIYKKNSIYIIYIYTYKGDNNSHSRTRSRYPDILSVLDITPQSGYLGRDIVFLVGILTTSVIHQLFTIHQPKK